MLIKIGETSTQSGVLIDARHNVIVYRNIPFNSWAGKRNKEEELQELSNLLQSLR